MTPKSLISIGVVIVFLNPVAVNKQSCQILQSFHDRPNPPPNFVPGFEITRHRCAQLDTPGKVRPHREVRKGVSHKVGRAEAEGLLLSKIGALPETLDCHFLQRHTASPEETAIGSSAILVSLLLQRDDNC